MQWKALAPVQNPLGHLVLIVLIESDTVFPIRILCALLSDNPGKRCTLNPNVLLKSGDDTFGIDSVECSTKI